MDIYPILGRGAYPSLLTIFATLASLLGSLSLWPLILRTLTLRSLTLRTLALPTTLLLPLLLHIRHIT